jgi:hypothetical protein
LDSLSEVNRQVEVEVSLYLFLFLLLFVFFRDLDWLCLLALLLFGSSLRSRRIPLFFFLLLRNKSLFGLLELLLLLVEFISGLFVERSQSLSDVRVLLRRENMAE